MITRLVTFFLIFFCLTGCRKDEPQAIYFNPQPIWVKGSDWKAPPSFFRVMVDNVRLHPLTYSLNTKRVILKKGEVVIYQGQHSKRKYKRKKKAEYEYRVRAMNGEEGWVHAALLKEDPDVTMEEAAEMMASYPLNQIEKRNWPATITDRGLIELFVQQMPSKWFRMEKTDDTKHNDRSVHYYPTSFIGNKPPTKMTIEDRFWNDPGLDPEQELFIEKRATRHGLKKWSVSFDTTCHGEIVSIQRTDTADLFRINYRVRNIQTFDILYHLRSKTITIKVDPDVWYVPQSHLLRYKKPIKKGKG